MSSSSATVPATAPLKPPGKNAAKKGKNRPGTSGGKVDIAEVERDLADLATRIREAIGKARLEGRQLAEHTREIGAMLAEAKPRFRRYPRQWKEYIEARCGLKARMVAYYIEFAEKWDEIEPRLDQMFAPGANFSIKRTLSELRPKRPKRATAALSPPATDPAVDTAGSDITDVCNSTDDGPGEGQEEEHRGADAAGESAEEPAESEDPAGDADPGQGGDACNTSGTAAADTADGGDLDAGSAFPPEIQALIAACQVINDTQGMAPSKVYNLGQENLATVARVAKLAFTNLKSVNAELKLAIHIVK
jgi:hypothetical protein